MAIPVLIIGKSGSGKSHAAQNCIDDAWWNAVNPLGKPFPFRGKIPQVISDDYETIKASLNKSEAKSIIVDDAGYLITNMFMRGHSSTGGGNAVFSFYNEIADKFWGFINFIRHLPDDKVVYVIMHEDKNDFGDVKPKTIGKMLDEKVCLEGMFTIVLRCVEKNGKHLFITQASEGAVSKSPSGMFDSLEIPNDLAMVDDKIREYWELPRNPKYLKAQKESKK